jgi:hypothetical protein
VNRQVLLGIAVGVLVPASALGLTLLAFRGASDGSTAYSLGTAVWSIVAFAGVMMIGFDRTRRVGLGILLGFCGLVLIGAGTCTAVVVGGPL